MGRSYLFGDGLTVVSVVSLTIMKVNMRERGTPYIIIKGQLEEASSFTLAGKATVSDFFFFLHRHIGAIRGLGKLEYFAAARTDFG